MDPEELRLRTRLRSPEIAPFGRHTEDFQNLR